MKVKTLGVALAFVIAAPAVIAPKLVANVHAADADYPDVPKGHWAYDAINKLSQAGIIEGQPGGVYVGSKPMTRYEFAVAIARLLNQQKPGGEPVPGPAGAKGDTGPAGAKGDTGPAGAPAAGGLTRDDVNNLIAALKHEFADELSKLGVRTSALEEQVAALNAKVNKPPRLTISPSLYVGMGTANYVANTAGGTRVIANGNNGLVPVPALPRTGIFSNQGFVNGKFSYTDLELRLTDRVTDRLSVNAALRSLSGTNEDPWAGDADAANGLGSSIQVREAYAVANLNDRKVLGTKDWLLTVGRQHTQIATGLLYDNDLSPTDQINAQFRIGPVGVTALLGTTNNNRQFGFNPYFGQGAAVGIGGPNGVPLANYNGAPASAVVGFSSGAGTNPFTDDNESLLAANVNLFKLAGSPVQLGLARQFDGVAGARGDSASLSIPLFNRRIGIEYVRDNAYSDGSTDFNGASAGSGSKPHAFNVTVPLLRTRPFDLNFAYGRASDNFEYFQSSAANPFARSYGEAVFDRSLALGAPLISDRAGAPGEPAYMAAKKVYDFSGTLRVIRKVPLALRYYKAYGSANTVGAGDANLGSVFTIGSTLNLTPGLDLELKYGQYNPSLAGYPDVRYFRIGANVGF